MLLLFVELLDASRAHNGFLLSVIVILRRNPAKLVTFGKHGVGQRILWQSPGTVGIRNSRRELDGAGYTIYRGDKGTALQYQVYDTRVQRLIGIASELHILPGILIQFSPRSPL